MAEKGSRSEAAKKAAATRAKRKAEAEAAEAAVVPAMVDVTQVASITVDLEQNGRAAVLPGHLESEGWRVVSAARFNQYRVEFVLVRQGQVPAPEEQVG